jgi:hypothetical protein
MDGSKKETASLAVLSPSMIDLEESRAQPFSPLR